jgi:glycine/D-amino acid oxidase-like deaminating enzyme
VEGIRAEAGRITAVTVEGKDEACDALVLAAGHSAGPL